MIHIFYSGALVNKGYVWCALVITASVLVAIVVLFTLSELNKPRTFYDNGVSDEEYIAITNQTVEAQKFLQKYPNAVTEVDRSVALAVDYRVESLGEYLRLRIFIDWRTNKPADMFIDNSGTYTTENLLEYIETVEFPK